VQTGEGKAPGNLSMACQYVKWDYRKGGDKLSSRFCCDRTRRIGFRLKEEKFRLDIVEKLFSVRVGRHWHRLPREVGVPHP